MALQLCSGLLERCTVPQGLGLHERFSIFRIGVQPGFEGKVVGRLGGFKTDQPCQGLVRGATTRIGRGR